MTRDHDRTMEAAIDAWIDDVHREVADHLTDAHDGDTSDEADTDTDADAECGRDD